MKYTLTLSLLLLCSCGKDYGVEPGIPVPPLPERYTKAEKLPPIEENSLGKIIVVDVDTDIKYNQVARKYNDLIEFYTCTRDSINSRKVVVCKND